MRFPGRALALLSLTAAVAGCDSGVAPSSMTPATSHASFLAGAWVGTVTIHREGQAETVAPTTWTFTLEPNTGGASFRADISLKDTWLPIATTLTASLAPATPGGVFGASGNYVSPRGCQGIIGSIGTADLARIDASFHGVDCDQFPAASVFDGHVTLTK